MVCLIVDSQLYAGITTETVSFFCMTDMPRAGDGARLLNLFMEANVKEPVLPSVAGRAYDNRLEILRFSCPGTGDQNRARIPVSPANLPGQRRKSLVVAVYPEPEPG